MPFHVKHPVRVTGSVAAGRFASHSLHVIVALAVLACAGEASATTVGCNGAPAGTYDFPTLSSAVSGAPLSNNTITIYGTCTDDVVISGAQNLTLAGSPGAVLMDAGLTNSPSGGVLEIDNSQNVTIQNLTIRLASYPFYGPFPGIVVDGSGIFMQGIDIEGSTGTDGIDINANSNVLLVGANTIENNNDGQANGEGISLVGPAASLQIGRSPGNTPSGCTVIQGNGDDGIAAGGQASVTIRAFSNRCVTIQNNGAFGVQAYASATVGLSNRSASAVITLSGNQAGAAATLSGHLNLSGPVLIQNNSIAGVWLRDASANFNPASGSPEGPVVQQNGGGVVSGCCMVPGGVSIRGNSSLFFSAGTVTQNSVPGVNVQDDSSAIVGSGGPVTITQNPVGVSVTNASTVALYSAPTISGNPSGDVVCGAYSVAYGDSSAVGQMHCDVFSPGTGGSGRGPGGNGNPGNLWR